MNKEKIGIDIDEVIIPFMKFYLNFHNEKYNTLFDLTDVTNYYLWKCGIHNSKEEAVKAVKDFQDSIFFKEDEFIEGAKEGINFLSEKYQIFFITSRSLDFKEKTINFFSKYFPNNNFSFIFSGEIHEGKTKEEICEEIGVKFMIEDNLNYAFNCAKKGIKTFLIYYPWNKNCDNHNNLIKVQNWNEILEKLNLII